MPDRRRNRVDDPKGHRTRELASPASTPASASCSPSSPRYWRPPLEADWTDQARTCEFGGRAMGSFRRAQALFGASYRREDGRRASLVRPAVRAVRAVPAEHVGESGLDVHELSVRAGGLVRADQGVSDGADGIATVRKSTHERG